MVKFLPTLEIYENIGKIIYEAKEELYFITPYFKSSWDFWVLLKLADYRGIKIYFVYGKNELNQPEYFHLKKNKNLELFFRKNLHVKCYSNENCVIITSQNLYVNSNENIEMGVLLNREKDKEVFIDAMNGIKTIIRKSKNEHIQNMIVSDFLYYQTDDAAGLGYCIRCKKFIPFNPDIPLCHSCLEVWLKFWNLEYTEKYCHQCGKKVSTTFRKPRCYGCWHKTVEIYKELQYEYI